MDLSNLKPAKGSTKKPKRIGRGQGSGRGGTSTRGHKGAQSRSGYSKKIGYEGGQMPLARRLPKYGFKNFSRVEYKGINLDVLQSIAEKQNLTVIDPGSPGEKWLCLKERQDQDIGTWRIKSQTRGYRTFIFCFGKKSD